MERGEGRWRGEREGGEGRVKVERGEGRWRGEREGGEGRGKVERGEGREKLRVACGSEEGRRWTEGMRVCICALKEELN